MPEQITINFEATEFEGFDTPSEYFAYITRTLRRNGLPVQQKYQAADLEMSPSQFSQKVNQSNNTSITLDEAFKHMDIFGDTRLLDYLVFHLKKKRDRDEIKAELERLQKQLDES